MEKEQRPQRLCSEIQLFDLCDQETCCQKDGRFCRNLEVLEQFEAIKEDDSSAEQYLADELCEDDEGDEEGLEGLLYDAEDGVDEDDEDDEDL
jgi:hypothetical protein